MLGDKQWRWLERVLVDSAGIGISTTKVGTSSNTNTNTITDTDTDTDTDTGTSTNKINKNNNKQKEKDKEKEKEKQKALPDYHVIVSSVQVLTSNPAVESWGHFPEEKERLFKLLEKYDPRGLVRNVTM